MLACILLVLFIGSLGVFFAGYFLGRNKELTAPILVISVMIFIWGTTSLHYYFEDGRKMEELRKSVDGKKLEQIQKVNAEAVK